MSTEFDSPLLSAYIRVLDALTEGQKQAIRAFFRAVEQRAEANMLKTGKLEGAHYAAMRSIMAEKDISPETIPTMSDTESKTVDYAAYRDPEHPGNSAEHHTGKACITPGCDNPAGTHWSPVWCFTCNVERIDRINRSFKEISRRMGLSQ